MSGSRIPKKGLHGRSKSLPSDCFVEVLTRDPSEGEGDSGHVALRLKAGNEEKTAAIEPKSSTRLFMKTFTLGIVSTEAVVERSPSDTWATHVVRKQITQEEYKAIDNHMDKVEKQANDGDAQYSLFAAFSPFSLRKAFVASQESRKKEEQKRGIPSGFGAVDPFGIEVFDNESHVKTPRDKYNCTTLVEESLKAANLIPESEVLVTPRDVRAGLMGHGFEVVVNPNFGNEASTPPVTPVAATTPTM
ncbi:MAG: hypothetical protein SFW66_09575 [Gammaproteobacteria bacterium]|nr:hypothetical protein [Gammaproteobacteria bacterium]